MTRQEVAVLLRGMSCTHKRMHYEVCIYCKEVGRKACRVECPDCGLSWMFNEGE